MVFSFGRRRHRHLSALGEAVGPGHASRERGERSDRTVGPGAIERPQTRAVRAPTAYPTTLTPKCTALITTNASRASGTDST